MTNNNTANASVSAFYDTPAATNASVNQQLKDMEATLQRIAITATHPFITNNINTSDTDAFAAYNTSTATAAVIKQELTAAEAILARIETNLHYHIIQAIQSNGIIETNGHESITDNDLSLSTTASTPAVTVSTATTNERNGITETDTSLPSTTHTPAVSSTTSSPFNGISATADTYVPQRNTNPPQPLPEINTSSASTTSAESTPPAVSQGLDDLCYIHVEQSRRERHTNRYCREQRRQQHLRTAPLVGTGPTDRCTIHTIRKIDGHSHGYHTNENCRFQYESSLRSAESQPDRAPPRLR